MVCGMRFRRPGCQCTVRVNWRCAEGAHSDTGKRGAHRPRRPRRQLPLPGRHQLPCTMQTLPHQPAGYHVNTMPHVTYATRASAPAVQYEILTTLWRRHWKIEP